MILVRLMLIAAVLAAGWSLAAFTIMVPGMWLILLIILVCLMARRRCQLTAFGTARWADASDLRGMTGHGPIVGRLDAHPSQLARIKALFNPALSAEAASRQFFGKGSDLVRLSRAIHTSVFIPTGGGKGASFVIPHLQTCPDPTAVVDFKGENARITAKARKAMGHRVVLLDPFRVVTKTPDTFNPLDFIDPASPLAIDECRDLAEALVVRTGQEKEPHWIDSAEVWIGAMIAAVVHFGEGRDRSLQAVRALLSDPAKMEAIIKSMCESDAWDGMLSRLGHQLLHFKDKELGSTLTTTNRFLRFLDTPAIAENTQGSSFDPADLLKGRMTVYLVLPPEHMRAQSPLLRMWIGSLLRAVVRGGLDDKRRVHFVLDEAASLGRMDALDDALDKYRGFGVRLQFFYQSLGQLKKCWPDGGDQGLLSNTSQVFAGVNDNQTAEYVSNRLGDETIVVGSGGTSTGTSRQGGENGQRSHGYSSNQSDNWSQQARRLLKPEEVMALPERTAITFTPGVPPIRTRLIRYYEEVFGRGRVGRAFSALRMFVAAAAILLLALTMAACIAGAVVSGNSASHSYSVIDDPLEGLDTRSFEGR